MGRHFALQAPDDRDGVNTHLSYFNMKSDVPAAHRQVDDRVRAPCLVAGARLGLPLQHRSQRQSFLPLLQTSLPVASAKNAGSVRQLTKGPLMISFLSGGISCHRFCSLPVLSNNQMSHSFEF